MTNEFPFSLKQPYNKPTSIGGMTNEELANELIKGLNSIKNGKTFTADEVDEELKKEFNI